MKITTKLFNNINAITILAILFYWVCPTLAWAEAGAKSMFASEGTSVMMNDDADIIKKPTKPNQKSTVASDISAPKSSPSSAVSYAGLQYWIDLQKADGHSQRVTTGYTFHSGDRIKLQIKSKTEGYLYVLNQDISGRQTPLYPARGQPSGLIQANVTYTIPTRGAIGFDNVPGNEKVTIALAKYPIPNVDPTYTSPKGATTATYSGQQSMYVACSDSGAGSKGMFAEDSTASIDCMRNNYGAAGSKGMFAEEDTTSPEPASYAIVPSAALDRGQVMFIDFNLNHR